MKIKAVCRQKNQGKDFWVVVKLIINEKGFF
jgi:hypothetical protein